MRKQMILCASLMMLSACASIVSGTEQEITVSTTPEGANCAFEREGRVFGRVNPTPGGLVVQKTKHDITIKCDKAGYETAKFMNESGSEGATLGNIILGGGIGWAVDSARGADNKYQENVHINMTKK